MNNFIVICTTLFFLTTGTNALRCQTFPVPTEQPRLVNDFTGILTLDEADALEIRLMTIFDSAAIHIVVVLVSDIGKTKISEYAAGLYEAWGLGRIEASKGILLLIHTKPPSGIREAFIEPDSSLKSYISEDIAAGIIKKELIPNFKNRKRFTALNLTADALISIVAGEPTPTDSKYGKSEKSGPNLITWILVAISAILIIRILITTRRQKTNSPN
jgi:uncharacterized protein